MNHNTFVNIGQHGLNFGEVITAHVTNNLFMNVGYLGSTTANEELDPDEDGRVIIADSLGIDITADQVLNVRNNNFYIDPTIEASQPDSVLSATELGKYSLHAAVLVEASGTDATNISEAITFVNGPADPTSLMLAYFMDPATAPSWDNTGAPYDFLYTGGGSATASTGMQPLGDLSWHMLEIVDSDRTTPLVDADDGAISLPEGDEGPAGVDLDTASGNQSKHITDSVPAVGDQVTVDIFVTEGASGQTGYQATLTWDPTALSLTSYASTDVFTGGLNLPVETEGSYTAGVAILGGAASADAGSIGLATFTVLDGFSEATVVTLTVVSLETLGSANVLDIGPGAAYVVIGSVGETPAVVKSADLDDTPGVGFGDFIIFAGGFNTAAGDEGFDDRLDLDGDGTVGFGDFLLFAAAFSA